MPLFFPKSAKDSWRILRSHSKGRLFIAVDMGIIFGVLATERVRAITEHSEALLALGLFVLLVAFSVSSVVVCLIARSHYVLVGMVPTVTGMLMIQFGNYLECCLALGMSWQVFLRLIPDAEGLFIVTGYLLASLAVSVFMHRIRTAKAAGVQDTPEGS
jgi:hypothetical protein